MVLLRIRLLGHSDTIRHLLLRRGTIRLLAIRLLLGGRLTRLGGLPIRLLRSHLTRLPSRLLSVRLLRLPGRLLTVRLLRLGGLVRRLRGLSLLAILTRGGIRAIGRDLPRRLLRLTCLLLVCHALPRSI